MSIVDQFSALLPKYACSMSITHNDHLGVYETVAQQVSDGSWVTRSDFVSDAECERAIETNELWAIQWYPDTPVGFYKRFASTLEALLEGIND